MRRLPMVVALAVLLCGAAQAQEQSDPAPWRPLDGRDAGAVGSCHRLDDDETVACMIVRCDRARGLELVYRHGGLMGEPHPTRYNLQIDRYRTTVEFSPLSREEIALPLAGREPLVNAMARPGRADPMLRLLSLPGQIQEYSTAFELTRAGPMIERVRRACRR